MPVEQSSEGSGSSGGIARSTVKRKLNVKSIEDKYQAILEVEKSSTRPKSEIARSFGVPANTLSTWIKNAAKIKEAYQQSSFAPERKRMRTANYEDVEHALLKWFTSVRDQNVPISGPMLTAKAEEFASRLNHPDFKCSNGWLDRFKERHNITFKKICGEAKSVNENSDAMNNWAVELKHILTEFKPDNIFNADETGLFFKLLPEKTLEYKGVDCSGGKRSKERITVLVCANMSGSEKIPLLVIGKSANPRCFKNIKTLPTDYTSNKKAWMTSEIFTDWIVKLDKKFQRQQRKVAMIVDNCPAHPKVKGLKNTTLVFLPPNTTSKTQPCDQGIIQNIKVHYRRRVVMKQISAAEKKIDFNISILDALRLVQRSWYAVTPTTISNCFRHAGFTTDTPAQQPTSDDSDDDDDIPLAHLAGLNFADYVSADNNTPTTEPLTEDDIIDGIMSKKQEDTPDSDDDEPITHEEKPVPSLSAMLDMSDTYQSYFETQDDAAEFLPLLAKCHNYLVKKQLKKKLNAKQCTFSSDISGLVSFR